MGGSMPYVIEKGPVWEWFDFHFGMPGARPTLDQDATPQFADPRSKFRLLQELYDPPAGDWVTHFIEASKNLSDQSIDLDGSKLWASTPGATSLEAHLREDWCTADGGAGNPPAGWMGWYTNPAEVMCRGFTVALETSLGLTHRGPGSGRLMGVDAQALKEPPPGHTDRPIEFLQVCPLPAWQVWIHARSVHAGELVTVYWATPGPVDSYLVSKIDDQQLANPVDGRDPKPDNLVVVGDEWVWSAPPRAEAEMPPPTVAIQITIQHGQGNGDVQVVAPLTDIGGYREETP